MSRSSASSSQTLSFFIPCIIISSVPLSFMIPPLGHPLLAVIGFFVSCYPFIASLVDFSPHSSALTLSWLTTVHAGARTAAVMTGLDDRLNWTCVRSPSVCVFCVTIHYQHFLLSILVSSVTHIIHNIYLNKLIWNDKTKAPVLHMVETLT